MRREREDGVKSDVLGHRLRHPKPDKETGLRPRICKTVLKQDKVMALITITEERQLECSLEYMGKLKDYGLDKKSRTKTIRLFGMPIIRLRTVYIPYPIL